MQAQRKHLLRACAKGYELYVEGTAALLPAAAEVDIQHRTTTTSAAPLGHAHREPWPNVASDSLHHWPSGGGAWILHLGYRLQQHAARWAVGSSTNALQQKHERQPYSSKCCGREQKVQSNGPLRAQTDLYRYELHTEPVQGSATMFPG